MAPKGVPSADLGRVIEDDSRRNPGNPNSFSAINVTNPGEAFTNGAFTPIYADANKKFTGKGKYKGPKKNSSFMMIALLSTFAVMIALVMVVILKPNWFSNSIPKENDSKDIVANDLGKPDKGNESVPPIKTGVSGQFPRRLLSINISNYLFMNPIHNGYHASEKEKYPFDLHGVAVRFMDKWRIPEKQVFEISDRSVGKGESFLPIKKTIEETIKLFCETSTEQDHIIFYFTGHLIEKEGQAFLVPIDGDQDTDSSLIPVKDIYKEFEACKSQQKLIIWDICRYSIENGAERPIFGKMTEGLEKALHSQPDGIYVWTACSKDEYSYEFNYKELDGHMIQGGLFMSEILNAASAGAMSKTGKKNNTGIQSPDEPLPIEPLVEYVNSKTKDAAKRLVTNEHQTPKFTGKAAPVIPYDPAKPPATVFQIPPPPKSSNPKLIDQIFKELQIPPVKVARKDIREVPYSKLMFFPPEIAMKYKEDMTEAEIRSQPDKYPFRIAVLDAFKAIRDLRQTEADDLPEEFRGSTNDAVKKQITEKQRIPATREGILTDLKARLEEVAKDREKQPPRWQANYDYVLAEVKFRIAYLSEYNLALGRVKKDELPPLEGKNVGWKLAAVNKMKSPSEIRKLAEEARETMQELIDNHPGSPWAILAKREKGIALGLDWQTSSFNSVDE